MWEKRERPIHNYVNGELQVDIHDQYNSKKGKSGITNKKGRKLCDKTKSLSIMIQHIDKRNRGSEERMYKEHYKIHIQ